MLSILAVIDGDDDHARRGERPVHEVVLISTDILSHPGSAMNIQNGWERTPPLRLVDGCLKSCPAYLQVIDNLRMDGKRRLCRCQLFGGALATPSEHHDRYERRT